MLKYILAISLSSFFSSFFITPLPSLAQVPIESTSPSTSSTAKPSNPKFNSQNSAISSEKRALIKELLEITESGKNAQQIMESMVRADLPKLVSAVLKDAPFLDSDRPEIQTQLRDVVSRMAQKYRDRVIKQINVSQLIEQVSYPIYDKYFTESELRDIIGFYKSSTGKKAIAILPQIVGDSMSRTNEILLPAMSKIMTQIIAEELLTILKNPK